MQESMKAVSGPAISARFAEQMQESMKALTGHLSPLPGASRANLRYVLGADASEILRNWAPQQAVAHAVELVSAVAPRSDAGPDGAQALAASAAVLLVSLLAIGPADALESIWIVGYLALSLLGHFDSSSNAFHGLVVLMGLLGIFSWRR